MIFFYLMPKTRFKETWDTGNWGNVYRSVTSPLLLTTLCERLGNEEVTLQF